MTDARPESSAEESRLAGSAAKSAHPHVRPAPHFPKPILVLSQCLELEPCRYNGERIPFDLVRELEPWVEYRPVCPEVEIGLGVPRDTIRLVAAGERTLLVQPATGRDVTAEMETFAKGFVSAAEGVDGFILKSRSPSCGLGGVKVYDGPESRVSRRSEPGVFAGAVLARYGGLAVEDEGRLRNRRIREHFLTKLFALARLREIDGGGRMGDLVRFQSMYKFVLLAYGEKHLRELGRIVANADRSPCAKVVGRYRAGFMAALGSPPRPRTFVNVFQHIAGFFSAELTAGERAHFANLVGRYRSGRTAASSVTSLLESWAVRFKAGYILDQAVFAPFPEALVSEADSGKGRRWR